MRPGLLRALADRPLLLDAAMGTRLIARGLNLASDDPALCNRHRPEEVAAIHQADCAAGSDALLSNTFGANANWLARFGRSAELAWLNATAVALARAAVGPGRYVLGSIGPTAWMEQDDRPLRTQAEALLAAGVDGLMLETFGGAAAVSCMRSLRSVTDLPLIAGLLDTEGWAGSLIDAGADVIGVNCVSPEAGLRMLESIGESIPKLWKPSTALAGVYDIAPDEFASHVSALLACGVRLIGGCCGTMSAHIAAARRLLEGRAVD